MSLINWRNRYDLLPGFPNWVDQFFRDDENPRNIWPHEMAVPAVNVKETDNAYELEVAVPGMKREDFTLEANDGLLIIGAKSENENEEKTDNYTRKEFNFSSFSRSFWLPENVKGEAINANYKEGILMIVLPKKEVAIKDPVKTIEIK